MGEDGARRRRPMSRIGALIPEAAARLGLADELRRARFLATFDAIVAELAPAAHGACRALRIEGETLVVEADAPIVGQELLLHADDLATAFSRAPGGAPVRQLRVAVRRR
jgi:Dna[CI] antecedent DciA-like protein